MGKKRHKYNTRSGSGQQNNNEDNENEENNNFILTDINLRKENKAETSIEETHVPIVPKHVNKKRAVRESMEEENVIEISNVFKAGPSASYIAEPKDDNMLNDSSENEDALNLFEEYHRNKKNKGKDKEKIPILPPKNMPPKIWREQSGIKLFKVFIEEEKIKGKSSYSKILMVKNLLFQNQIEVGFGKIETTNKVKKIVIFLPKLEDVQKAKMVNLGDDENCIYLQDVVDVSLNN